MGTAFGRALKAAGFDIITCLDGRSALTRARATATGFRDTGDLETLVADADLLLAPTAPFGLSNDLMAATPGHPLFTCLLDELATSHRLWGRPWVPRHFQIMCGTGSLFLSRVFARLDAGTSVRLLTSGEYGHGSADEALVHHIEGNSWAGWDTKALVFLQDRWPFLMVGTLILIAVLASP